MVDAATYIDGDWSMEVKEALNDPALTVLNVGVTDDLAGAQAKIRKVWGGPQFGSIRNRVDLQVSHDDGSIRAWVDEEYGPEVVEVTSAVGPVE